MIQNPPEILIRDLTEYEREILEEYKGGGRLEKLEHYYEPDFPPGIILFLLSHRLLEITENSDSPLSLKLKTTPFGEGKIRKKIFT
jgi:hypothetical protein